MTMTKSFTMTYEVITPESAEQGDIAEHGFCEPGGWRYSVESEPPRVSLREALNDLGCLEPNDSRYLSADWWTEIDGHLDYSDGSETFKSIHLPRNITPSSRSRVNRLIKARQ